MKSAADYTFYLSFIATVILVSIQWFNERVLLLTTCKICNTILDNVIYSRALVIALTYTWAQDNGDTIVTFYFLKMKATYLPLLMLFLDLILGGQFSMLTSGTGYVAGHLYLFLDDLYPRVSGSPPLIKTPRLLHSLFPLPGQANGGAGAGMRQTPFGTAYNPAFRRDAEGKPSGARADSPAAAAAGASSGASTGFGGFSFRSPFQGKGRRLGD